jgi:hypothetical protein
MKHWLWLMVGILLSSCSLVNSDIPNPATEVLVVDNSPLDTAPCQAPCWENIQPGQTTEEQVLQILEANPTIAIDCINEQGEHESYISCSQFAVWFDQDKVTKYIFLNSLSPITLEQLIHELGDPDRVYFEPDGLPEYLHFRITIAYLERGIWVTLANDSGEKTIMPDMVAINYEYWPIGSENENFAQEYMSVVGGEIIDWHGYGSY